MEIHPVKHVKGDMNRYCGPSAISIVTGMTTGEAARLLRHVSRKRSIKGTSSTQMYSAFEKCGIYMKSLRVPLKPDPNISFDAQGHRWQRAVKTKDKQPDRRPTLAQWLRDSGDLRTAGRVFLVSAGNHWQIITGRRFCCGITRQIVGFTHDKVMRRARVSEVYELTAGRLRGITIPDLVRKPKKTITGDKQYAEVKKLEREYGFKGRIERDGHIKDYVVPACDLFPRGFSTMHHDWWETLSRLLDAIADYEAHVDEDGHMSR